PSRVFARMFQPVEKHGETLLQGSIDRDQGQVLAEIGQAGDAIFGDAARHDAAEMREVRSDVERKAVQRHPALHAHAERTDLRFPGTVADPDSNASLGAVRGDPELGERVDHPAFERMDETAYVSAAPVEVEHHVADALAGPMIGVAAAPAGLVDR